MGEPHTGRGITNERKYPYVVELAVDTDELSVELSRRMLHFHKSRNIQVRHGRNIRIETQNYFDGAFPIWRQPDLSPSNLVERSIQT
jgi:hypothetical protein